MPTVTGFMLHFFAIRHFEARYPEQKLDAARMLNKEASQYLLDKTKELTRWIEEHLASNKS